MWLMLLRCKYVCPFAFWNSVSLKPGADLGFSLGGGRLLSGGIFSRLRGRHVPEGRQGKHINEGVECALQIIVMWWSFLTMLVMVWFNNRSKHRLVSKQYKYSKQWSFSAHTLRIREPKNAPVPMIDKKKLPGITRNNTYIPRAGTFWAVGPTYISINIHRSKRTMPPRAASPLARRAGSSWWRLVWSGAQRKLPRSGAAQTGKKTLCLMKFFYVACWAA